MPRSVSSIITASRARAGSPSAQRVASRPASWLEPVQTGHDAAGSPASTPSTIARSGCGLELRVHEQEVEGEVELVLALRRRTASAARGRARRSPPRGSAAGPAASATARQRRSTSWTSGRFIENTCLFPRAWISGWSSAVADRVVAQLAVLDDAVRDVDAPAGDPAVEPEAQDLVERLAHLLAPPVEVGLGRQEVVQVELARRPRRASTPGRRTSSASCWAASRRASGPPTRRSRGAARRGRRARPGTTRGGRWCGWGRGRAARGCRAGPPRRSARRGPRACRGPGCTAQ